MNRDDVDVDTSAFLAETPPQPLFENEQVLETNSSLDILLSTPSSILSTFNPCADAISHRVCINYAQLAVICIACFTVLLMIFLRVLFCCVNKKRRRKRLPDILAMESDMVRHTRLNSISTLAGQPPPRYSQIFDQDGISVFEEAPPDYETTEPDLLKSLPQNLSRTSSLASKGPANEQQQNDDSGRSDSNKNDEAKKSPGEKSKNEADASSKPDPVVLLSIDSLIKETERSFYV